MGIRRGSHRRPLMGRWCIRVKLRGCSLCRRRDLGRRCRRRSEEHTSELQSRENLVCRLLLEKNKKQHKHHILSPQNERFPLHFTVDSKTAIERCVIAESNNQALERYTTSFDSQAIRSSSSCY